MAIKAIVKTLEEVPEQYRDLYTERNGQFEMTGVEGMKTEADVTRLSSALDKERKDHKAVKDKFSVFGDRTPEQIVEILDRVPELEAAAAGKIDENKINQMVETRIGSKTAPLQRQIQQLQTQVGEKDKVIEGFTQKERTRSIHDAVRESIGKAQGFQVSAMEDALLLADRVFDVNEEGKVVTKDGVGVTPGIDATVWLTEMQQKRPHWWGTSSGGGSTGNGGRGGAGGGANPWTHDNWNMTEQGRIYKENPQRAEQMAKSAGTKVGGMRPAKK